MTCLRFALYIKDRAVALRPHSEEKIPAIEFHFEGAGFGAVFRTQKLGHKFHFFEQVWRFFIAKQRL